MYCTKLHNTTTTQNSVLLYKTIYHQHSAAGTCAHTSNTKIIQQKKQLIEI